MIGTERIATRAEVGASVQGFDREAYRVRRPFVNRTPQSEDDLQHLRRRTRVNRYVFMPHRDGDRDVWNVYEIRGAGVPSYVTGGFWCAAEAVAKIGDLLSGRQVVSFAGVRELFRAPKQGTLLVPDRSIAVGANVPVVYNPDGSGYVDVPEPKKEAPEPGVSRR